MKAYPEIGRKCAVCGRGQTPRLGGLAGFATKIELMVKAGIKVKDPKGRYAHLRCITSTKEHT